MRLLNTLHKNYKGGKGFVIIPTVVVLLKKPFHKTPFAIGWLGFFAVFNDRDKTM